MCVSKNVWRQARNLEGSERFREGSEVKHVLLCSLPGEE